MSDNLRRGIDGVSSSIKETGKTIANVSKAAGKVHESVDKLSNRLMDSSALQAVDLLTDNEIDELRELIHLGDEAASFARKRLEDNALEGMYMQLSDLGFVHCIRASGAVIYLGHTTKANWAVARHDKQEEIRRGEKSELKRQRSVDRWFTFLFTLLGFVLGIIAPHLSAFFGSIM